VYQGDQPNNLSLTQIAISNITNLRDCERLATIVGAADTNQPELAAESKGLLAASLGLSRMFFHAYKNAAGSEGNSVSSGLVQMHYEGLLETSGLLLTP
jgi:hypothetical protein